MIIGVVKEKYPGENRVALTPSSCAKLIKAGFEVSTEFSLGKTIFAADEDYKQSGVMLTDRQTVLSTADIIVRVRQPPKDEVPLMKKGAVHISLLDPFQEHDLINVLAKNELSAISLQMLPRSTLAQKMDALSSQANLAGYEAVIIAAERLQKIMPMMMTPAGTISPSRVFVIGAGVAGLQAIATARRLGARVEAFDTRPTVEEQVQSLGAKFVKVDIGETSQTKDGYAKELTPDQLEKQRQAMTKVCAQSDIVITTAQLFGRKAPVIIKRDMIEQMKPGSVIVDLAVESGGNVEGIKPDEETVVNGVRLIGLMNLPGRVVVHASAMFSNNITSFIEHFYKADGKIFALDKDPRMRAACLITHQGKIVHEKIAHLIGDK